MVISTSVIERVLPVAEIPSSAWTSPVTLTPAKLVEGTGGGSAPSSGLGMHVPIAHAGWVIAHWS